MEYDLHNSVLQRAAVPTTAIAADGDTDGGAIDTLGYESVEFIALSGTLTDGTYTLGIEESNTGAFAGEENVVDAELVLGAPVVFAAADDDTALRIGTIAKKRYVRLVITAATVTTGGTISAVAVLSNAHTRPTPSV